MTLQIKILLGLLLAAAIGMSAVLYNGSPGDELVTDPGPDIDVQQPEDGSSVSDLFGIENDAGSIPDKKDELVRVKAIANPSSGANYAQGIKGIVVDENDRPVADATLFLMPGMGIDSLRMYRQHQQGVRFLPLAQTVSDADGAFRLGVKDWVEDKKFALRVLHDEFCDVHVPGIVPQPNEWLEYGRVRLKIGITVFGRVTSEAGVPIHGARVYSRDGSGQLNLTPAPGREDGKLATTDENGEYVLNNLDPTQMFALRVVAENFATDDRTELQLSVGKRHQVDFQLTLGLGIAGTVVNPKGKSIRGAKVTIAALSQKSQQTEVVHTDADGYFISTGLRPGMFTVIVDADGYLSAEEKPVTAGQTDLAIILEMTGSVIVTVLNKNGEPLPNFHCNLKAAFDGSDTFGNALISQRVKNAEGGTVTITGIKPMTYVAEVFAGGHAKNFSERFTITAGQAAPPRIVVKLDEGGSITGVVEDEQGNPVKGVNVATNPNKMIENPFTKMFQMSMTVTQANTVTNSEGEFRFDQLYGASYQLVLTHGNFCTIRINDVAVQTGQETQLGDIRIIEGCLVTGIAYVSGKPAGQVRVNVSAVAEGGNPVVFSAEAITDNEGKFLITKRLVPGRYQFMAAENIQANPLLQMVQFHKSKKEFQIRSGEKHHILGIRLQPVK